MNTGIINREAHSVNAMAFDWNNWFSNWPVITDGAWGTELQNRGLNVGECPDAWNLDHPERVADVARTYRNAGSSVVLTNTFRANRLSLDPYGLGERTREINVAGARISKEAAPGVRVFGSMGPSGRLLSAGEVTAQDLYAAFREQAEGLREGGADALLIETFSDPEEARTALEAAKTTGLPVVVSFAFDSGKNKDRTMTGATPEEVATKMVVAGADAVGANCGTGVEQFVGICRRMHAVTAAPIWIKANAGVPEVCEGRILYRTSPHQFASIVPSLRDAGASFIGGCCGTGPAFIRAVSAVLGSCA